MGLPPYGITRCEGKLLVGVTMYAQLDYTVHMYMGLNEFVERRLPVPSIKVIKR